MYITPISFRSNDTQMQILQMRNTKPVEAVKKIESRAKEEIPVIQNDEKEQQNEKTAFRGADALANYNRAMLVSTPISTNRIKVNETKVPEKIKTIEVDTPTFKAEEGIENLEAAIDTKK